MPHQKTYCRICEAACGLIAELDEGGLVMRLLPDKTHPVSQGYVCAKGTRFSETAVHANRLTQPQIRQPDGSIQVVSWDEAISVVGERIRPILAQHGPHAVGVYYGNPMLFNAQGLVTMLNFNRVLGTRNVFSSFSQDCNNKFAGAEIVHDGTLMQPIPDLDHAEFALILGMNPAVSQGSFVHLSGGASAFNRFAKKGGCVVWIDPRKTESAQRWGKHVAIRPGTDIYLLLALLHEFRDQYRATDSRVTGLAELLILAAKYPIEKTAVLTQIPADTILELANRIRQAKGTTFHLSVGVNMGPFGTLSVVAVQALAYLTGNFDQRGGLLFHPLGPLLSNIMKRLHIGTQPKPSRVGSLTGVFDELPGGILAEEILTTGDGKIRALIVLAGNPLTSIPGENRLLEAFADLEFMVQIDMFSNATSEFADVLLPAKSWLERWDVATTTAVFQQESMLQYSGPVGNVPGEARSERQILAEMSVVLERPLWRRRRLANWWGRANLDRGLTAVLDALTWPYRQRKNGAYGLPTPRPKPGRYLRKKRQVRFWHARLVGETARLATYAASLAQENQNVENGTLPLTLITRRRRLGHNSWLHGGLVDGWEETAIWLHPNDMKQGGFENGDTITLLGNEDAIALPVKAQATVMPGSVVLPHGLPDVNVNRLIPSGPGRVEPVSGNHWMTGIPVRLVKKVKVGKRHLLNNDQGL